MKKIKTILAFAIGVVATAIFGACSCTPARNVTVTSISLTTSVENGKLVDNKLVLDVVKGDTFDITYTLTPKAATNTKVYVDIMTPGGSAFLTPEAYIFDEGVSKAVRFVATGLDIQNEPTQIEVKFTTDNLNRTASAVVRIYDLPDTLDTPQNLAFGAGKVTWDEVENAGKYIVSVNGVDYETTQTNFTPNLQSDIQNTISVTAISTSIEYANSLQSQPIKVMQLSSPTITSTNNGRIVWEKNQFASNYIVEENGDTYTYTSEVLLHDVRANELSTNQFNVKVKNVYLHQVDGNTVEGDTPYVDDDGVKCYVISSAYTSTISINRITNPTNVRISNTEGKTKTNGTIVWDGVTGANLYTVKITDADGQLHEYSTRNTYFNPLDYSLDYKMGRYSVVVSAQGNESNTIKGDFSDSDTFQFVKMGYLSGSVDTEANLFVVDTTDLINLGLSSNQVENVKYLITFISTSTGTLIDKNVVVETDNTNFDLTDARVKADTYSKIIVRPFVDGSVTNIANATVINNLSSANTYSLGFTKLSALNIQSITGTSVLTVKMDTTNVEYLQVALDEQNAEKISISADCITSVEDGIQIDLAASTLSFGFGTNAIEAGTHTLKVYPVADEYIDATKADCADFEFVKLAATTNITVVDNKLTWDNVENYGYMVTFNSNTYTQVTNTFAPIEIKDSNTASIIALGNGTNVINSDTALSGGIMRADKIQNFSLEYGTLKWTEDHQVGSKYVFRYYNENDVYQGDNKDNPISDCQYSDFKIKNTTKVSISRRVLGKFDSVESEKISFKQKVKVDNVKIVDNQYKLSYDNKTSNVVQINVTDTKGVLHTKIYNVGNQMFSGDTATITLTQEYLGVGTNYISVINVGSTISNVTNFDYVYDLRSTESDIIEVEVLPQITASVQNGSLVLSIDSQNSPASFYYQDADNEVGESINVEGKSAVFDVSDMQNGASLTLNCGAEADPSTNIIDVGTAISYVITKLDAPTINVVDGSVEMDAIDGAQNYIITLYDSTGTVVAQQLSANNNAGKLELNMQTLNGMLIAGIDYTLKARSIGGSDCISSNYGSSRVIQKLPAVNSFGKEGEQMTWQSVQNNNGYYVQGVSHSFANNIAKDSTSFSLLDSSFVEAGKYTFSIYAKGNTTQTTSDVGYLSSDASTTSVYKLNAPQDISISGGVVAWQAYESIDDKDNPLNTVVKVTVDGSDHTYNCGQNTSFDMRGYDEITGDNIVVSIYFVGNGNDIINSDVSLYNDGQTIARLQGTTLRVVDGVLRIDKNDTIDNVVLFDCLGSDHTQINKQYYTLTEHEDYYVVNFVDSFIMVGAARNICVQNMASEDSDNINSFYSSSLTVSILALASNALSIGEYDGVDGRLIWDKVDNATSYTLYINGEGASTQSVELSGDGTEFFDIADLGLEAGTYYVRLRANGSVVSAANQTNYLNSNATNSVTITITPDNIVCTSTNDVLSWESVEGVLSYKLTITDGENAQTYLLTTTSFNLKTDANLQSGKSYSVSVVPYATNTSYYVVKDSNPFVLQITKAKDILSLYVSDGILTWKVDTSDVSLLELPKIAAFYDKYKDNPDAVEEDEEGKQNLQKYFHYWNFELILNGVSNYIVPSEYLVDGAITQYITFKYNLSDAVAQNTTYNVNIRSRANSTCVDEDGEVVDSVKTIVSGNLLSTPLTVCKTVVPSGMSASDGKITFNLVLLGEQTYVKDYYVTAIPQNSSNPTMLKTITINDDYFNTSPAPTTYTFDMGEWFGSDDDFNENVRYIIKICTCGSTYGDTTSTETLYLRSNYYSSVSMTFLGNINLKFSNDFYFNSENIGSVINWTLLTDGEAVKPILYIMPYDQVALYGNDWWKSDNVIKIQLEATDYFFDFAGEKAQEEGIVGDKKYIVAAKYGGDERSYITNTKDPDYIYVTTLPAVSFGTDEISDGKFSWNSIDNAGGYKVELCIILNGGTPQKTFYYTTDACFEPDVDEFDAETTSYSISVMPLGSTGSDGTYYANGRYTSTSPYYKMQTVQNMRVEREGENNYLVWDSVEGATKYIIQIDETQVLSTQNKYLLNDVLLCGQHNIKVKGNATKGYLNGDFSSVIEVIKLYNPKLKVTDGIITWDRNDNSDAVLKSAKTILNITECDASGNSVYNGYTLSQTLTRDEDTMKFVLPDEAPEGAYFRVSIKYDQVQVSTQNKTSFQLSSDVYEIITKKQVSVSNFQNGKYVGPDSEETKECSFDNYIKWFIPQDTYGFEVRVTSKGNIFTTKKVMFVFEGNAITGLTGDDAEYFEFCVTDGTYMCFNLAILNNYSLTRATILVCARGNTTAYIESYSDITETLGYLNSNFASFDVEIPGYSPKIVSSEYGVLKWTGQYILDSEGQISQTISSDFVNCDVEIQVSNVRTYDYDEQSHTITENSLTNKSYLWKYTEDTANQVFYIPFASYSGFSVKVRYVTANFVGEWSAEQIVNKNNLFFAGMGTQDDPYILDKTNANLDDLKTYILNIKYRPNAYFALKRDVDMSDATWKTISSFGGVIDGENHTLSNISLNNSNISMFTQINQSGCIKNLTLSGLNLYTQNKDQVAPLAITNSGTIQNVTMGGAMYVYMAQNKSTNVGGMVVTNLGTIQNCISNFVGSATLGDVDVVGINVVSYRENYVGGIAKENQGVVSGCVQNSTIVSAVSNPEQFFSSNVGGIVCNNISNANVFGCTVNTAAYLEGSNLGGIVCVNNANAHIKFCAMHGECKLNGYEKLATRSGLTKFGGLVSENSGYVSNSYVYLTEFTFTIDTQSRNNYIGWLIGVSSTVDDGEVVGKLSNCYVYVGNSVSLPANYGFVVGLLASASTNASENFQNIYVSDTSKKMVDTSEVNGVSTIAVEALTQNNNQIKWILSGVGTEEEYEALDTKFVVGEQNTPPYVISLGA